MVGDGGRVRGLRQLVEKTAEGDEKRGKGPRFPLPLPPLFYRVIRRLSKLNGYNLLWPGDFEKSFRASYLVQQG